MSITTSGVGFTFPSEDEKQRVSRDVELVQVAEVFFFASLVKLVANKPEQAGEGLRTSFSVVHCASNLPEEVVGITVERGKNAFRRGGYLATQNTAFVPNRVPLLGSFPSAPRSTATEVRILICRFRLHITDGGVGLLVRRPAPVPKTFSDSTSQAASLLNIKPIHIHVPTLVRPWVMPAWHASVSRRLDSNNTLTMTERLS